jgi:hypothetical protein
VVVISVSRAAKLLVDQIKEPESRAGAEKEKGHHLNKEEERAIHKLLKCAILEGITYCVYLYHTEGVT